MKLSDDEWKKKLTPEQYRVLREKGTEAPFSGKLLHEDGSGDFVCAACGAVVFKSGTKFDSGSGWPSFFKPLPGSVGTATDKSLLMQRTEVHCSRCGSHLGHVFPERPRPTGERYCMNGVALKFEPKS